MNISSAERSGVGAPRATPWRLAKQATKRLLAYQPLVATEGVRRLLSQTYEVAAPYCPPAEGDLLYTLVTTHRLARCLQVGFATGSTALYLLAGAVPLRGEVDVALRGVSRPRAAVQRAFKAKGLTEIYFETDDLR